MAGFVDGFSSGFADSFVDAREKKKERDADKENMMFKYQMEGLAEQKTKRDKRKAQEAEWAGQAKLAAQRMGDPSFATEAYNQFANGRTLDQLYGDIDSGNYKRDPNYIAPSKTIAVPTGVAPKTASAAPEEEATPEKPGMFQQVSNKFTNGIKDLTGQRTAQDRVNERIDELDPNLRKTAEEDEAPYKAPEVANGWSYQKTNELKLKSLGQAMLEREKARQSGNAKALAEADLHIGVQRTVMAEEASARAKAEGKQTGMYMYMNKDGTIGHAFSGTTEKDADGKPVLLDDTDPRSTQVVDQPIVRMSEQAFKDYRDLATQYGKDAADVNNANVQFIGALQEVEAIDKIIARNPEVTTYGATGVELIQKLGAEAQGAYKVISNAESEIEALANADDPESKAAFQQKVQKYEEDSKKFFAMSDKNNDLAYDKALYETRRRLAAYKFAAANGQEGRGASDTDIKNFYQATGGGGKSEVVREALYSSASSVLAGIDARRVPLEGNKSVEAFEKTYLSYIDPDTGERKMGKTGFTPDRIQNVINKMGPGYESLSQTLAKINAYKKGGRAVITGGSQSQQAPAPAGATARPRQGTPAQAQPKPTNSLEGKTATNKQTGQKMIHRNGKWEIME